jgi:hypothetical protein
VIPVQDLWDVFLLFMIPGGGGIPAGAIVAHNRGLDWLTMSALYFASDVVLACLFEPVLKFLIRVSRKKIWLARFRAAMKLTMQKILAPYGVKPHPFILVTIAFGLDPMSGRTMAHVAGHGFFSGWAIAITGDMFFFLLIAVSTLILNSILGNGTWAALIVMTVVLAAPLVLRRIRGRQANQDG